MDAKQPARPAAFLPAEFPSAPAPAPSPAPARERRIYTVDQDPDGDGIANRRTVITEVYDESGTLVERIREQDFEADGIIDARSVTHFDGVIPPEP